MRKFVLENSKNKYYVRGIKYPLKILTMNAWVYVQWLAKRDVDSIDNHVRYQRENIKYLLESLY